MCKCVSIDTYIYIAQLITFVRVSISIIACDRVQNDREAAFCVTGVYSIYVGLEPEPVLICRQNGSIVLPNTIAHCSVTYNQYFEVGA